MGITSSTGRSGLSVKSGMSIYSYWPSALLRSVLLLLGERYLPSRPVGLTVVALAILIATLLGLPSRGIPVTGNIPEGLPAFELPAFGMLEFQELFPISAGCLLLAYIEGVSAGGVLLRTMGMVLMFARNFSGWGQPTLRWRLAMAIPSPAGCRNPRLMMPQERARRWHWWFAHWRSRFACFSLRGFWPTFPKRYWRALSSPRFTSWSTSRALLRMWRVSRIDFYAAAIALVSVLLLGILQGVLLAALASIFLLLGRASQPNIAFLGRLPGTGRYSDSARHEGVEPWWASSRFGQKLRCFTSMPRRFWRRY